MDGPVLVDTSFERYTDEVLLKVHANLLQGIDRVSASLLDGSFKTLGPKGEASPSQSGHLSLAFLALVSLELAKRGLPSVAVDLDRCIREAPNESR